MLAIVWSSVRVLMSRWLLRFPSGWHDQTRRPQRIGLRERDVRHRRQRGSARCEMEKISAENFHSSPSAACNPMGTGTNKLIPFLRSRKWQCRLLAQSRHAEVGRLMSAFGGKADMARATA